MLALGACIDFDSAHLGHRFTSETTKLEMMADKWQEDLRRLRMWRTASEELLNEDPQTDYRRVWQENAAASTEDSRSIDEELREVGVPFSVGELANVRAPYPEAIPVMLKHLHLPHLPNIQEAIIRAISVPYAGEAALTAVSALLANDRESLPSTTLYALGNAIAEIAGKEGARKLRQIASDPLNRDARFQPLLKLGQIRDPETEQIARQWLRANEMPWYAMRALRRARAWSAINDVKPFQDSDDPEIRAEARRFLKAVK